MKILVLGASQGTGALAVAAALERGHEVTAFARHPERLALRHSRLTKLAGDFHERAAVEAAVPGHDAVVVTASATSLRAKRADDTYYSRGTRLAIDAMQGAGVKRLVLLSALGAGDSRPLVGALTRALVVDFVLKKPYADHDRQERMARATDLEWVIARPARLTDGPAKKQYRKTTTIAPVPPTIARADVADFLIEACAADAWVRQTVQLGG